MKKSYEPKKTDDVIAISDDEVILEHSFLEKYLENHEFMKIFSLNKIKILITSKKHFKNIKRKKLKENPIVQNTEFTTIPKTIIIQDTLLVNRLCFRPNPTR